MKEYTDMLAADEDKLKLHQELSNQAETQLMESFEKGEDGKKQLDWEEVDPMELYRTIEKQVVEQKDLGVHYTFADYAQLCPEGKEEHPTHYNWKLSDGTEGIMVPHETPMGTKVMLNNVDTVGRKINLGTSETLACWELLLKMDYVASNLGGGVAKRSGRFAGDRLRAMLLAAKDPNKDAVALFSGNKRPTTEPAETSAPAKPAAKKGAKQKPTATAATAESSPQASPRKQASQSSGDVPETPKKAAAGRGRPATNIVDSFTKHLTSFSVSEATDPCW